MYSRYLSEKMCTYQGNCKIIVGILVHTFMLFFFRVSNIIQNIDHRIIQSNPPAQAGNPWPDHQKLVVGQNQFLHLPNTCAVCKVFFSKNKYMHAYDVSNLAWLFITGRTYIHMHAHVHRHTRSSCFYPYAFFFSGEVHGDQFSFLLEQRHTC